MISERFHLENSTKKSQSNYHIFIKELEKRKIKEYIIKDLIKPLLTFLGRRKQVEIQSLR